jgi:hypothetical protein
MIYFLLFLHYGFYVFFIMCFAAYIYAATKNNVLKIISTLILILYTCLELTWILYILLYLKLDLVVLGFWVFGVIISLIITGILSCKNKADISIWIPFSVIFSPVIIIPILIFIRSVKSLKIFNS